jgi:hypothetical protein
MTFETTRLSATFDSSVHQHIVLVGDRISLIAPNTSPDFEKNNENGRYTVTAIRSIVDKSQALHWIELTLRDERISQNNRDSRWVKITPAPETFAGEKKTLKQWVYTLSDENQDRIALCLADANYWYESNDADSLTVNKDYIPLRRAGTMLSSVDWLEFQHRRQRE